jgi:hypothetical protein
MDKPAESMVGRRGFLRVLGTGSALVVAAGASRGAATAVDTKPDADEKRKARYRESEHVKTFYRVNRYPG